MKQHWRYMNEVTNALCNFDVPTLKFKLTYKKGLLYLEWPNSVIFFSLPELLKIHRRLAHPTPNKLANLLKKAAPKQYNSHTRQILDDIAAHRESCQRMASKPFLFQVSMPDNIQFNYEIILDLTWIEPRPHKPVLNIEDRGTHISAAEFLKGESSEDVWNTFISTWVTVYVGFPNILLHDFGSAFSSDFSKNLC